MIISASRRTDIPAFYSHWFFKRLEQGFVMVRNPFNPMMVRKIDLNPNLVDGIVFWSKNPRPMMDRLELLNSYHFYFLFTITAYGPDLEKNLPAKEEVIDTFIELAQRIGKEKVIWRYDPIFLSGNIDDSYHSRRFEYIAGKLHGYTERCIISFLDMYKKCERNLKEFNIKTLNSNDMQRLAGLLGGIARQYDLQIVTCAEEMDFQEMGIGHGKCIDDELLRRICGHPLVFKKDPYQRKTCRCVESVDIGTYDTCPHHCLYCYANSHAQAVERNAALHDPASPFLLVLPDARG
jgi:hypothetical protein